MGTQGDLLIVRTPAVNRHPNGEPGSDFPRGFEDLPGDPRGTIVVRIVELEASGTTA